MWLKNAHYHNSYFDYNAGSGLADSVRLKLISLLNSDPLEGGLFWANPSSRHQLGQKISGHLYQARRSVAKAIVLRDEDVDQTTNEIIFTASGTDANQSVIRSALESILNPHKIAIVVGATEHAASYDLFLSLKADYPYSYSLPVLANGQYDFPALEVLLADAKVQGCEQVFVSLAWVNNETGVIQDLLALRAVLARAPIQVSLHLDAAQAWGKLPVDVTALDADYVTFSAHKIGAFAGTGVIWNRKNMIRKAGTENAIGIIALGYAAHELTQNENVENFSKKTIVLQRHLEQEILNRKLNIKFWGKQSPRVSNTTRMSFSHFSKYENWVELLDLKGFAVSHGSACKSQTIEPSRVLLAMGASKAEALNSIRVSFGADNTLEEINLFLDALASLLVQKISSPEVRI